MRGDGAASGDLNRVGLLLGRGVRRVAECAHVGSVSSKDEPVLATVNKCLVGRVGECDVCKTAQENDPSVCFLFVNTGVGRGPSETERTERLAHCGGQH